MRIVATSDTHFPFTQELIPDGDVPGAEPDDPQAGAQRNYKQVNAAHVFDL